MHNGDQKTIILTEDHVGKRLDKAVAECLPDISRADIQRAIKDGRLKGRNGSPLMNASVKITAPLELSLEIPHETAFVLEKADIPLDVLFEDEHIAVINKQAGLTVHPGAGVKSGTLVNALIARYGLSGLAADAGEDRPGIVHRLDKETSGLMLIARTNEAYQFLKKAMKKRQIERTYMAVVWGTPSPREDRIATFYGRHPKNRLKMAVLDDAKREAITYYKVMSSLGLHNSMVECTLDTGRTHQIRVHMAHIGHPVIGDPVYGPNHPVQMKRLDKAVRKEIENLSRQALHAYKLSFPHPDSEETLRFASDPADDMQTIINFLKS